MNVFTGSLNTTSHHLYIHYQCQKMMQWLIGMPWLKEAYRNLIRNSTLLTNSEYSRKAVFDTYGIDDAIVISPPVDVDTFCNAALLSLPLSSSHDSSSPLSFVDGKDYLT